MATNKDVLTFRVETTCTFQATLYKATDECKSDEQSLWQFPADMIFEVPQHFKAIEAGLLPPDADGYRALVEMGPDDETEAKRAEFFKEFFAITRDGTKDEAQRHAEVAVLKENFKKFGQAKDPDGEAPPEPQGPSAAELAAENEALKARLAALEAPKGPKAPEDMSKDELGEALAALGFEAPAAMAKADRLAKLYELKKAVEA